MTQSAIYQSLLQRICLEVCFIVPSIYSSASVVLTSSPSYSLCDLFAKLRTIPTNCGPDLNIPLPASQAIFYSASRPTQNPVMSMTQSAASMMGNSTKRYSTSCAPLDQLLQGGLKCGHVLEISGPPGCGKEQMAARAIKSFVQAQDEVLFVGTAFSRSQFTPSFLRQSRFFFLCHLLKAPSTDMPTASCGLHRHGEHDSSRHHQENPVRCVLPRHLECRPALTKPFFSLLQTFRRRGRATTAHWISSITKSYTPPPNSSSSSALCPHT